MGDTQPRNYDLLSAVYAGAVTGGAAATWDDTRAAKESQRLDEIEAWGQELKASRVGELLLSCDGLKSGRGSCQGQHDDGFEIQPGESNVLSLHYLNPPRTTWVGELITADLTFTDEGEEIWGIKVLTGIRPEPQIVGGYDHGFKNVGVYECTKVRTEEAAYEFLENYVQTHDCAQILRDVIGRNLRSAGLIKAEGPSAPQA